MNVLDYLDSLGEKLRSCQREAVKIFAHYAHQEVSEKALLINLPTGAGKTGVISLIAHLSASPKVLVICHRRAVKDQLFREISKKFFRSTLGDLEFKLKNTYKDKDFNQGDGVYITSFQKLSTLGEERLADVQESFGLILVDEGHAEPSPIWREIIRQSDALKVVVTATPYRNDLFELNVSVDHFYVYTFKEAVDQGVISAPIYEQVKNEKDLLDRIRERMGVDARLKCIVKCKDLEEIRRYHALLSPQFVTVSVHDRLSPGGDKNEFARVGPALKVPGLRVIIHQHKLDEGVDIPEAKILLLTYELGSGRELVQAVGRIVRHYQNSQPYVLDVSAGANEGMWDGYQKFDAYLAAGGAKDFVRSLSTSYLIEKFLGGFPVYSYFDRKFKERVDLNELAPDDDIKIPYASVCFVRRREDFSLPLLMDRLYWDLHGSGALVKVYNDVFGLKVLIYVEFGTSKFFSKKVFFEPKLNVLIVKEVESGVAVFDSGGGRYYSQARYRLGDSIEIGKLAALTAMTNVTRIKETHARAIGQALRRPESVALKGRDLSGGQATQSNSRYALTMVKADNLGFDGTKESSYYIGARSGRVADQKDSNFTLEELSAWIDDVDEIIQGGASAGRLIKSYAQSTLDKPDSAILSLILDFTELAGVEAIGQGFISPEFVYVDYANGVAFDAEGEIVELDVSYSVDPVGYEIELARGSIGNPYHEWVVAYLNAGHRLKILFEDGTTYLGGMFYRLALPYERGITAEESFAGSSIFAIDELSDQLLSEKGDVRDHRYYRTSPDEFDSKSIFSLIDRLKGYGSAATPISDLGPFAKFIPGCDLVLCTDMGVEPADFILSSPEKLCFVHIKCGDSENPKSSAGAIAEVGSQAIKNIHFVASGGAKAKPGNFSSWRSAWPSSNADFPLDTRFRLIDGVVSMPSPPDDTLSNRAWDLISSRRESMRCKKEIWVVMGNSFSSSHFSESISNPALSQPASIQAFQLVENWLSTANELDVEFKIFTSD